MPMTARQLIAEIQRTAEQELSTLARLNLARALANMGTAVSALGADDYMASTRFANSLKVAEHHADIADGVKPE